MANPPIIAVLGMHRAGTSLTAGMLQALGVRLSENLMPPTEDNPAGYFEDADIVQAHEAILYALGNRTWSTSSSMIPLPEGWTSAVEVRPLRERLKRIAQKELEASTLAWAFKDPRTAQFLPLWNELARELHTEIRSVIVLRHPREVSESLRVRDRMNPVLGEILWVEHYVDALLHTNPGARAYIPYNAWFEDSHATARSLANALRLPSPDEARVRDLAATLVSPGMRHHHLSDDEPGYLPYTREFYKAMLAGDEATLRILVPQLHLRRVFSANVIACAMELSAQNENR